MDAVAPHTPASAVATTGSDVALPGQPSKRRIPAVLNESSVTGRMRLLVEYVVHGVSNPILAAKIKREIREGDKVVGTRSPDIGEPLTPDEAAVLLHRQKRWARRLMAQPVIERMLARETAAFRNGERAHAWRHTSSIMRDRGAGKAADRKVQLQAAAQIIGEPKSGTTVNVQTNVGFTQKAGVIWRIPETAPQVPGEQQQIEGKAE